MALLKTPAQKTADKILANVADLLNRIALVNDSGYNAFWADPVNVAAALGPVGVNIMRLHALLSQVRVVANLAAALPVSFPGIALTPGVDPTQAESYVSCLPAGWTYSVNSDGSLALVSTGGGS
jgi:hypothetical protein